MTSSGRTANITTRCCAGRATLLDDTLGPEAVAAFFCESAIDVPAVREDPRSAPPGCTVDRLDWVKVRAR